ncbi:MAG: flavin reductase family protein [Dehalococcoidia bacterium]|nr:flavin reductase family protein [Dehalococcoidia bacterium]MCK4581464.1 flavin reductase family protein [Dehalococcoidia bacterium]
MGKILMGPSTLIYPMPVLLVGANVDGKANFMAVAWGGIANGDPPMISVALRHQRHTYKGIRQNSTFSVNIASVDLMKEADYCGLVSGAGVNKAEVCKFKVFYGKLGNAPLIEQCPVNLECRVVHILGLESHALVIGKIEETHVSEECLTDGKADVRKIRPFAFSGEPDRLYQTLEDVARAFSIGKELKAAK